MLLERETTGCQSLFSGLLIWFVIRNIVWQELTHSQISNPTVTQPVSSIQQCPEYFSGTTNNWKERFVSMVFTLYNRVAVSKIPSGNSPRLELKLSSEAV